MNECAQLPDGLFQSSIKSLLVWIREVIKNLISSLSVFGREEARLLIRRG